MVQMEQWEGFQGRLWKEEINTRDFIQKNYKPYDGDESNFIWFDAGMDAALLQEKMAEKGIRIGAFAMSRVSVGTIEECKLFIRYLAEILKEARG